MRNDYSVVVGLDWADEEHAVCWKDGTSGKVHSGTVKHRQRKEHKELSPIFPYYYLPTS